MTVDDWRVKYEIVSAENDKLGALLGNSNAKCAYCELLRLEPTRQDLLEEMYLDTVQNRWCEAEQADVYFAPNENLWYAGVIVAGVGYIEQGAETRSEAIQKAMKAWEAKQ